MRLGLGIRVAFIRAWRSAALRLRHRPRVALRRQKVSRLHIGSGQVVLDGWTNVDLQPLPGVDYALDVRDGLPFCEVDFVYAEHFIEHLTHDEGCRFLAECRAALKPDGVLRLSTPNLDWVWSTQYQVTRNTPIQDCFALNKAFRGWGHQFLFNVDTLRAALHDAGFAEVTVCSYGESAREALRNLEKHEKSLDAPELPHVIILEATGTREPSRQLQSASEDYDWAMNPDSVPFFRRRKA